MRMKTHEITFTTAKSIDQIKGALQGAVGKADVQRISDPHGGLLATESDRADLELLVQKQGFGGAGAVQIYVYDQGASREVLLIALGDGALSRSIAGVKNTASLGKSMKMAEQLRSAIQ